MVWTGSPGCGIQRQGFCNLCAIFEARMGNVLGERGACRRETMGPFVACDLLWQPLRNFFAQSGVRHMSQILAILKADTLKTEN